MVWVAWAWVLFVFHECHDMQGLEPLVLTLLFAVHQVLLQDLFLLLKKDCCSLGVQVWPAIRPSTGREFCHPTMDL